MVEVVLKHKSQNHQNVTKVHFEISSSIDIRLKNIIYVLSALVLE